MLTFFVHTFFIEKKGAKCQYKLGTVNMHFIYLDILYESHLKSKDSAFGDLTNLKTASEIFLPVQYMSITTHIPYTMQNRLLFSGRLSPYCILGM